MKKPLLEDIAPEVDISQTKGVFYIPEIIRGRRVIRYFLEFSEDKVEPSIVVLEEKYTRQSVMYKLGPERCYNSNRNLVIALLEYGLLRTDSGEKPSHQGDAINNLSLAQVISFAYKVPLETILMPKSYFLSEEFLSKNTKERVRILFNAYKGTSWFERFRKKYKRRKSSQRFNSWHDISLRDLPEILCTSDYEPHNPGGNLTKLLKSGLLIPKNKFKRSSLRNFVDIEALIELVSLTTGKSISELTIKDYYIDRVVESYMDNRLLPYLKKNSLKPDQRISLKAARLLTGIGTDELVKRLRIKLPTNRRRFYSQDIDIYAFDLAAYELKNSYLQSFGEQDVAFLFGMKKMDLERCGLRPNKNGRYARHQRVFPFYDKVAAIARKKILKQDGNNEDKKGKPPGYSLDPPTKTYEQIIRENELIQRRFDLIAKRQQNPVI